VLIRTVQQPLVDLGEDEGDAVLLLVRDGLVVDDGLV
jgi:hypothetical protein